MYLNDEFQGLHWNSSDQDPDQFLLVFVFQFIEQFGQLDENVVSKPEAQHYPGAPHGQLRSRPDWLVLSHKPILHMTMFANIYATTGDTKLRRA